MRIDLRPARIFCRDNRGGVAIIFSFSILALAMVAGLAIDHARAFSTQQALQQDTDSTLLFIARRQMQEGEGFDAQHAAAAYFKTLNREVFAGAETSIVISQPAPDRFRAHSTSTMRTYLGKLFDVANITVGADSEVVLGPRPVEVALVLDNTASMGGAKLDGLKDASKALVDIAYAQPGADENVRIGIVPFGQYVNIGQANRHAPWVFVPNDSTVTGSEVCYMEKPVIGTSNCHTETRTYMNDGVPVSYEANICDYTYGPEAQVCYTPTTVNTWNGCVGSRNYPLETLDGQYETQIPGVMNAACPSEITGLTNDVGVLKGQVDAMVATGETYLPSGLIWGWRVLSKEAPYAEAMGYNELKKGQKARKILVLMSDGKNTLSPTYPEHTGTDVALANSLSTEICTNIKAKGIEIFSVAFQVDDASARDVLQGCATSTANYFDAQSVAELETAFAQIASEFNPLRLTR